MPPTFKGPLSYDEMHDIFRDLLGRALSGAVLPPTSAMSDLSLTLALLDIVHAVRSNRPTEGAVARACRTFARFAARSTAVHREGRFDIAAVA